MKHSRLIASVPQKILTFASAMGKFRLTYPFVIFAVGYIAVILSALAVMLGLQSAQYAFFGGTLLLILGRYLTLPRSDNFRVRRLNGILAVGAIFLIASCYLMYTGRNAWVVTLVIAAVFDFYTSFRYPKEE